MNNNGADGSITITNSPNIAWINNPSPFLKLAKEVYINPNLVSYIAVERRILVNAPVVTVRIIVDGAHITLNEVEAAPLLAHLNLGAL